MGIKNKKSETKEVSKELQLQTAETKRHVNTYGSIIGGTILVFGVALTPVLTSPFSIIAGAVALIAGVGTVKCGIDTVKNQKKAMELQESIVESVDDKCEAISMQMEASKELDKEKKKMIAGLVAVGLAAIVPVTNTIMNALKVENINKNSALTAILSGLSLLGSIIATSELSNGVDHQKVLTLKKSPWGYKMYQ